MAGPAAVLTGFLARRMAKVSAVLILREGEEKAERDVGQVLHAKPFHRACVKRAERVRVDYG